MSWAKPTLYYAKYFSSQVATSTATGFDVANLIDMKEGTKWKATGTSDQFITATPPGGTQKTNYFMIVGHNLNTVQATVDFQYSSDNFSGDINSSITPFIPDDDKIIVREITEIEQIDQRVKFSGMSGAPFAAIIIWGEKAVLDYATVNFDPNSQIDHSTVSVTSTGYVSDINNRWTERRVKVIMHDVDDDCYQILDQWWENSFRNNFGFGWEVSEHSSEIYLMRPLSTFRNPLTNQGLSRTITLDLVGRKE